MPILVLELSGMRVVREGERRRREKVGERRKGEIVTTMEKREPAPIALAGTWIGKEMVAISPGMDEVEE
jgi:hypothetical protein